MELMPPVSLSVVEDSTQHTRTPNKQVITTSEDGTCKVTDIAQRATVASLTCPAPPFAATPIDDATLAVGFGRRVGLWDRRAPTLQQGQGQPGLPQAGGLVTDVAAAVGAPLLLSSSVDGTVKVHFGSLVPCFPPVSDR